ncbi:hypothetical protein P9726_15505 [Geobacillus stearothermophilus]|uniref:hypothetical protein n=1 Tax=Geobacillus stearothermophilus TaxID=1422 RepID=UPI002E21D79B|nr:hypothetical protein [Geobacillus stearothermophilus]
MKITTHQRGIFTEKFHEQFLLSTRDENGHSKGAHFHGKGKTNLEKNCDVSHKKQ